MLMQLVVTEDILNHACPRVTLVGFSYIFSQSIINGKTIRVCGVLQPDIGPRNVPDTLALI
jgi:hypothetical protein